MKKNFYPNQDEVKGYKRRVEWWNIITWLIFISAVFIAGWVIGGWFIIPY